MIVKDHCHLYCKHFLKGGCMNEVLYPELINYIYAFCGDFKTLDEKIAGRTILYMQMNLNQKLVASLKNRGWYSDERHIIDMLAGGRHAFVVSVATRIYYEHREQLKLNVCPRCFKIAKTPLAKQCQFCFYSWHDKVECLSI